MTDLINAVLAMAVKAMDPEGTGKIRAITWAAPTTGTQDWRGAICVHYRQE